MRRFANVCAPLDAGTSAEINLAWEGEMESTFQTLKKEMISPTVLAYPDFGKIFIIETDTSKVGLCTILSEERKDAAVYSKQ